MPTLRQNGAEPLADSTGRTDDEGGLAPLLFGDDRLVTKVEVLAAKV